MGGMGGGKRNSNPLAHQQPVGLGQPVQHDDVARRDAVLARDAVDGIALPDRQQQGRRLPTRLRRGGIGRLEGWRHPFLRRRSDVVPLSRSLVLADVGRRTLQRAERVIRARAHGQQQGRHQGSAGEPPERAGLAEVDDHSMTSRSHVSVRRWVRSMCSGVTET